MNDKKAEYTKSGLYIPPDPNKREVEAATIVVRNLCKYILAKAKEKSFEVADGVYKQVVDLDDLEAIFKELVKPCATTAE